MKKFVCTVCGYVYEGEAAPEKCPLCGAPAEKFKELLDMGVITQEEFDAKKKQLLGL